MRRYLPLVAVGTAAIATAFIARSAFAAEQVPYDILRTIGDDIEVRRYAETIVAETEVDAEDFSDASDRAFRRLAGYIFGGNDGGTKIAMTAPVSVSRDGERSGTRIAMTSPVATSATGTRRWRMQFAMPSEWRLDTLPTPNDPGVRLATVPARHVAALRFSGRGTAEQFARHETALLAALDEAGVVTRGKAWTLRYNAPSVPPFLRRNEVAIEVVPPNRRSR